LRHWREEVLAFAHISRDLEVIGAGGIQWGLCHSLSAGHHVTSQWLLGTALI